MYPHGRSLVKKQEGKPFALTGVNSDSDRRQLKETVKKERITWRSFWDGGSMRGRANATPDGKSQFTPALPQFTPTLPQFTR